MGRGKISIIYELLPCETFPSSVINIVRDFDLDAAIINVSGLKIIWIEKTKRNVK